MMLEQQEEGFGRVERRTSSSISRPSVDHGVKVTVDVNHLSYYVGPKKDKQILFDVSCRFEPGTLTAVMGPSGSGKTTLISNILGNAGGKQVGSIYVNGLRGPPKEFKSVAKLVPQEDVLLTSFTVRETFYYQAELVLQMTKEEKEIRIQRVVDALNLQSCLDVKIGTVDDRGISGGQRKRVSIGMDMLSNPQVLCLDEPTSGLDSKTAEDVVRIIRKLAHDENPRTVIATIHQPSYRIFSLFDRVLLITAGRVAFLGGMRDVEDFFTSLGFGTPPKENPADHFMRLLQDEEIVPQICDEFAKRYAENEGNNNGSFGFPHPGEEEGEDMRQHGAGKFCQDILSCAICCEKKPDEDDFIHYTEMSSMLQAQQDLREIPDYPVSKMHQFKTLFSRSLWDEIKDPNKMIRALILKLSVAILVGVVWWQAAKPPIKPQTLFPTLGSMFMILMNSCIATLASTLLVFPTTRSLLLREYKNGSYSLGAFYFAMISSLALLSIFYAFVMSIPIYLMVGLQMTAMKFLYFTLIIMLMTIIGNALGIIIGATSNSLIDAQNRLAPTLAPLILFSGYVIPYSEMKPLYRFFYHISFFQYGLSAMQINQLTGSTIEIDLFWGIEWDLKGEYILKNFRSLDPETHHVSDYIWMMFAYAVGITLFGYFIIQRDLRRKTG